MALSELMKGILGGPIFTKKGRQFFFGQKSKMKPFNKEALQALLDMLKGPGVAGSPLFQSGSSFLQNLLSGSPEAFQGFEAPFMQNFEQNIVPTIAERFAGAGTGGALSSSGLNQALAQAGRNLQTDLAGLRSNLQFQALPQALGFAQQPFSNRFGIAQAIPGQYFERPGQPGFLQSAAPLAAQFASSQFGMPGGFQ